MSNNEDIVMNESTDVISNTEVVETSLEVENEMSDETYQTTLVALTSDMNSLISEVGADNKLEKKPIGKFMFNQEKNVLTWYKNLVEYIKQSTSNGLLNLIIHDILNIKDIKLLRKNKLDYSKFKVIVDDEELTDDKKKCMLYTIVNSGLNKIFLAYKFTEVCKKFQVFNCENSFVEELRQHLQCSDDMLEYLCDFPHKLYLVKKFGNNNDSGTINPKVVEFEQLVTGKFIETELDQLQNKLGVQNINTVSKKYIEKVTKFTVIDWKRFCHYMMMKHLCMVSDVDVANEIRRVFLKELNNSIRDGREINSQPLQEVLDKFEGKNKLTRSSKYKYESILDVKQTPIRDFQICTSSSTTRGFKRLIDSTFPSHENRSNSKRHSSFVSADNNFKLFDKFHHSSHSQLLN